MSRSFKKHPCVTDNVGSKERKRFANKRFRRKIACEEDIPARSQYKKYWDSWNIHDFRSYMDLSAAIDYYYYCTSKSYWRRKAFQKRFPRLRDWIKYWYAQYKRK